MRESPHGREEKDNRDGVDSVTGMSSELQMIPWSVLTKLRASRKLMGIECIPPLYTGSQSLPTGLVLGIFRKERAWQDDEDGDTVWMPKEKGRRGRPNFMGTSEKVAWQMFGVKNCHAVGGCHSLELFQNV